MLLICYTAIPLIDPLKKNIASFRPIYNLIWLLISCFLFYIFCISMAWNLGYTANFILLIVPGIAILWYGLGSLLSRAERNWFVGVRTPWTLSSDTVWKKTHVLAGKLFKIAALVTLLGLLAPTFSFAYMLVIFPVMAIAIVAVIYSFIEYRKEEKLRDSNNI
jgi:uncharacterized membrane protein